MESYLDVALAALACLALSSAEGILALNVVGR
jgi:hypothetical protein